MANQQLVDYIKESESKGFKEKQLRKALKQQDWPKSDINEAFKEAHTAKPEPSAEPGKPSAKPSEKLSEKAATEEAGTPEEGAKPAGIKKRNPFLVLIFTIITVGIYGIYWIISTTKELENSTTSAPNPWLLLSLIIPPIGMIVMIYYYWKYSKAINELTGFNNILLFVLWILVGPVGMIISQMQLNKKAA